MENRRFSTMAGQGTDGFFISLDKRAIPIASSVFLTGELQGRKYNY